MKKVINLFLHSLHFLLKKKKMKAGFIQEMVGSIMKTERKQSAGKIFQEHGTILMAMVLWKPDGKK